MVKVVTEIDDCRECPFAVDLRFDLVCSKFNSKLIPDKGIKEDNPVFNADFNELYPVPDWCPIRIDNKPNILDAIAKDWSNEVDEHWEGLPI